MERFKAAVRVYCTPVFKIPLCAQEDKVFGVISTKQISDELKKMGYSIDKKCLKVDHSIDSLGTHEVMVELHKRVVFPLKVVLKK